MSIRGFVKRIPVIGIIATCFYRRFGRFPGSMYYWEHRYLSGGDSGAGSRGKLAAFKADVINNYILENHIESVVEFGCGDGSQLFLANYKKYIGLDVSSKAIELCKKRFSLDNSKEFFVLDPKFCQNNLCNVVSDLSISLDVIYHLIEDEVFHQYMLALLYSSRKYVIICSSNSDESRQYHEKHRKFSKWIDKHAPEWELVRKIDNPYPYDPSNPDKTSKSNFYIFMKYK